MSIEIALRVKCSIKILNIDRIVSRRIGVVSLEIVPADLTRNLWALGEVAPNLIARLCGNSLQTNNSNSSTDNSINIQNLDATFNTQSDFDGHRFLTDLRNQVILTANNH